MTIFEICNLTFKGKCFEQFSKLLMIKIISNPVLLSELKRVFITDECVDVIKQFHLVGSFVKFLENAVIIKIFLN
jgi:hypothetical protein